jgi:glycosyltransferase involved in cell wall biosynthesis
VIDGTTPVKVVHVLGTLDRGGVETIALRQCRTIPSDQVHQTFVILGEHEGLLATQFREAGARIHRCPLNPKWTFSVRLWRLLRALRPDVVESHVCLVSGLVLTVAAVAGVDVRIARMRSEGDGRPDTAARRAGRAVLRAMVRRAATSVFGVTQAALAFAAPPEGDARFSVVPNKVDVDRFASVRRTSRGADGGPVMMTHVGRASPVKNRGFLVEVYAEARRLYPDVGLTFVGPGGTADLEEVWPTITSDRSVRLIGHTDRVEDVLAATDVLLLPSRWEGLPNVVLEALAAGVPVLASDLPGMRELAVELCGITLLPLEAGSLVWACSALALAETPDDERALITEGIRSSRFAMSSADQWWKTAWTARQPHGGLS